MRSPGQCWPTGRRARRQVPANLPAELVGRRPDIVAQRWRVEAAGARIEGAKKDFYPNINLAAFVGVQSLGFGHFGSRLANARHHAGHQPAGV
jgi:outer membrane protein TolC